jgi:hypothetical protein
MPRGIISGQAARRFTGGVTELEVGANNFRRIILELDRRFPGLGRQIDESMAVAIDGEIFQDAYLVPLKPGDNLRGRVRQDHWDREQEKNSLGRPRVNLIFASTPTAKST